MNVNSSAFDSYREVMGDEWETFISGLIDIFMDSAPKQIVEMHSALVAEDSETLKRIAHTFKSSAATIGADHMYRICAEIEHMLNDDDLEGSRVLVDQLERVMPKVLQELDGIRPEV